MSEIPELTTRDVLQQIDRRLTLIEKDVRQLHGKLEGQGEGLRAEMKGDNTSLRQEMQDSFSRFRQEMQEGFAQLRREMDTRFRWLTGIVLASWLSIMSTLLLK
tara:strand:- start:245 stop:556 length:312 start_codon:yes stop_codon:yes gene_type:complete